MKTKNLYMNIGLSKRKALIINTLYPPQFCNRLKSQTNPQQDSDRYFYHPDDDESDYRIGTCYRGKVHRVIETINNHPRAIEVEFPDGKITTVHRRSFEVSETAIDFYPVGVPITLKKVGYMEDRRVTKWVIIRPLKYNLYDSEGIKDLQEHKRVKAGETSKYRRLNPSPVKEKLSLAAKLMGALRSVFSNNKI